MVCCKCKNVRNKVKQNFRALMAKTVPLAATSDNRWWLVGVTLQQKCANYQLNMATGQLCHYRNLVVTGSFVLKPEAPRICFIKRTTTYMNIVDLIDR